MTPFKPNLLTVSILLAMSIKTGHIYAQTTQQEPVEPPENIEVEALENKVKEEQATEVIEVRGFRRSVIESVNIKRFSDTMVDAVTADDLGALPDLSIADALSRLPGVTSVRQGGQSSELNIRGLSGQFVFATLNGREQVSSAGGRSVEFSQFPSELINTAQVHKSQKASLIEGGVAGTIELKTANPLLLDQPYRINFNGQLTNNSRADDHPDAVSTGHRFSVSYQGKFLNDTLGVGLGYARLFAPRISTQFVGYNFNYSQIQYDGIAQALGVTQDMINAVSPDNFQSLPASDCGNPEFDDNWQPGRCVAYSGGFEMMSRGGEDNRNGLMTSVVWQPNDTFQLKADAFYSTFDSSAWDKGLSVSGLGGITSSNNLRSVDMANPVFVGDAENGYSLIGANYYSALYTDFATYDPSDSCIQATTGKVQAPCIDFLSNSGVNPLQITNMADDATRNSETLTLGVNASWIFDDWSVAIDWSHSKASEDSFDRTMSILMFEDASVDTPKVETDLALYYQMNGLSVPTVNFTNTAGEPINFTDINKMMVTSYSQFPRFEENQADAVRLDFEYQLENDFVRSIEAGIRASERTHSLDRGVWSYGGPGHFEDGVHRNLRSWDDMRTGNYILYNNNQEEARFQPYQLSADEVEVVNLGGEFSSLPNFLSINSEAVADRWLVDQNGNPLDRNAKEVWNGADWTILDDSDITEKVQSAYIMANIDATLFDLPITGNIGIRYVRSEQSAFGVTVAPTSRQVRLDENGEPALDRDGNQILDTVGLGDEITDDVGETRTSHLYRKLTHTFNNVLPSLNLSLAITDNDYIKFAYAKVIARPELSRMKVSGNYNYVFERERDGKNVVNLDMSTSPFLEPFQATQYDLSFEHYFSETDGNVFAAFYYKDIQSFTDTVTLFDYDFAADGIVVPEFSDNGRPVEPGDLTVTVNNDKGGYVRGFELGYTQTFTFLPAPFSGLGFSGSYSHTESEITRTVNIGNGQGDVETEIEGLSPNIYSFTLFYNYNDIIDTYLNARYREAYLGRQISVGQDQSAFFAEETIIDYQIKYNVTEKLNVTFSVNNLTDEANRSYFGDETKTGTIQYFGRNYFLGLNYTLD